MGKVDRSKSDWDVMEHVIGGVRTNGAEDEVPRARVVHLDGRPWKRDDHRTGRLIVVACEEDDEKAQR